MIKRRGWFGMIVFSVVLSVLVTGCNKKGGDESQAAPEPKPAKPESLAAGMSQDTVIELLGEPSGHSEISGKTVLFYKGFFLEFNEAGLVMPKADVLAKANQQIGTGFMSNITATSGTETSTEAHSTSTSSGPHARKIKHPVYLKAERAMYDAERAAHERAQAVFEAENGPDAEYEKFPSYEEWRLNN